VLIYGFILLAGGIGVLVGFREDLDLRGRTPREWVEWIGPWDRRR
jgi:hypothetical protein